MLQFILSCLWYLVPAALSNLGVSFGNRLLPGILKKYLDKIAVPIDSGKKWRGCEIFGKNKTWRGGVVGISIGILMAGIQKFLFNNSDFFRDHSIIDYNQINFMILGVLMGGGALLGDLLGSFIKRRLRIPPGKSWFPWDQIDWIFGAIVLSSVIFIPSVETIATTFFLYLLIHILSDRIQLWAGVKKREEVL